MIRAFLAAFAALVVVLAFVLDRAWLYGAAAASLVGVLGELGRHFWRVYRQQVGTEASADASPNGSGDSLEDLGIMEVREESGATEESPSSAASSSTPDGTAQEATASGEASTDEPDERWPDSALSEAEKAALSGQSDGLPNRRHTDDRPVLGPYLESLRAALEATSVCLLVQEEVVLEYRVDALASVESEVRYSGTFETREPLLSATMSRQPVTVQSIDPTRRQDLGYYETAPEITQIAVAPIQQPDSSATVFLLVDATQQVDLGTRPARSLLEKYAGLGALLLDLEAPITGAEAATEQLQSFVDAGEAAAASANGNGTPAAESGAEDEPRPRRDIIAEEMEAADAADAALALVLVHLNRAESIARRGDEAVASAEHHLESRLEDLAPGPRVERFGELTYGLFVRRGLDEVEQWAADLQETMAHEAGELEGGVSVGVAIRHEAHDPESLRADATDALLEAYETGTCTIVA
jgi:hypothetical protein